MADTYINGIDGFNRNYGQNYELKVNYDGREKILLRFDLSQYLPRDTVITAAELELYAYNKRYSASMSVRAHEILRPWAEDGATWFDAAADAPWQGGGCTGSGDKASMYTAEATLQYTRLWQSWEGEPLVELVQRWVSDPSTNHGVVLMAQGGPPGQWWTLHSSQYVGDKTLRPRLGVSAYLVPLTPTHTATRVPTSTNTPRSTRTATPTNTPTTTNAGWYTILIPVIRKG